MAKYTSYLMLINEILPFVTIFLNQSNISKSDYIA